MEYTGRFTNLGVESNTTRQRSQNLCLKQTTTLQTINDVTVSISSKELYNLDALRDLVDNYSSNDSQHRIQKSSPTYMNLRLFFAITLLWDPIARYQRQKYREKNAWMQRSLCLYDTLWLRLKAVHLSFWKILDSAEYSIVTVHLIPTPLDTASAAGQQFRSAVYIEFRKSCTLIPMSLDSILDRLLSGCLRPKLAF